MQFMGNGRRGRQKDLRLSQTSPFLFQELSAESAASPWNVAKWSKLTPWASISPCKCVQRTMEANRTLGIFGQKVWTLLAYVSFTFSSLIGTIIVGLALKFGTWLDASCKNDIPWEVLTWICMSLKQTLHQIRSTCLDSCLERRPRTSSWVEPSWRLASCLSILALPTVRRCTFLKSNLHDVTTSRHANVRSLLTKIRWSRGPQQLARPDSSSRCSAATRAASGHSSLTVRHNTVYGMAYMMVYGT